MIIDGDDVDVTIDISAGVCKSKRIDIDLGRARVTLRDLWWITFDLSSAISEWAGEPVGIDFLTSTMRLANEMVW